MILLDQSSILQMAYCEVTDQKEEAGSWGETNELSLTLLRPSLPPPRQEHRSVKKRVDKNVTRRREEMTMGTMSFTSLP